MFGIVREHKPDIPAVQLLQKKHQTALLRRVPAVEPAPPVRINAAGGKVGGVAVNKIARGQFVEVGLVIFAAELNFLLPRPAGKCDKFLVHFVVEPGIAAGVVEFEVRVETDLVLEAVADEEI